jgi:tetratricopeptide (TPR) repeat protein
MFEIRPLSAEGLSAAIEKAERYRLLNEPLEAESICRDVLTLEPTNQKVLAMLLLALTDQFEERLERNIRAAQEVLEKLDDEYSRLYYAGLINERRAKCCVKRHGLGSGHIAYDLLRRAMEKFEQAAAIRPEGNDDAILRWNTCVRMINLYPSVQPVPQDTEPQLLE